MAADLTKSIPHIVQQLTSVGGAGVGGEILSIDQVTAAVDLPSLTLGLVDSVDVVVTGAAIGDLVLGVVTADKTGASGDVVVLGATVVAANTVRVTAFNTTAGTVDATSEDYDFILATRS